MKKRVLLIVPILLFQALAYANGDEEQSKKIRVIDDDSIPEGVVHRIRLPERPAKSMRPDVTEIPGKPEHFERPERPERPMRPEHVERPERPERPMRPNRPGR